MADGIFCNFYKKKGGVYSVKCIGCMCSYLPEGDIRFWMMVQAWRGCFVLFRDSILIAKIRKLWLELFFKSG